MTVQHVLQHFVKACLQFPCALKTPRPRKLDFSLKARFLELDVLEYQVMALAHSEPGFEALLQF